MLGLVLFWFSNRQEIAPPPRTIDAIRITSQGF